MSMRWIGRGVLIALAIAAAIWIALLALLPNAPEPSGTSAENEAGKASPGALAVPIAGVVRARLTDSWGDPRDNGLRAHHGTDIVAPAGTPVLAAAPGTVEKLFVSAAGGNAIYIRSPDRRWTYYYAHLAGYANGLREGQAIAAGTRIGYVGDTGNAGAGNYHLHFGLTRTTPAQHWYEGHDVDPYPYLAGKRLPR